MLSQWIYNYFFDSIPSSCYRVRCASIAATLILPDTGHVYATDYPSCIFPVGVVPSPPRFNIPPVFAPFGPCSSHRRQWRAHKERLAASFLRPPFLGPSSMVDAPLAALSRERLRWPSFSMAMMDRRG